MVAWIHFNESGPCLNFVGAENKIMPGVCTSPRLQYIQDYGLLPLLDNQSLNILMLLSVLRFVFVFFISVLSVFLYDVCLTVTMTSSTQGTITGYLQRALMWIGNVFVYHTCKTVRITYKYVIIVFILQKKKKSKGPGRLNEFGRWI